MLSVPIIFTLLLGPNFSVTSTSSGVSTSSVSSGVSSVAVAGSSTNTEEPVSSAVFPVAIVVTSVEPGIASVCCCVPSAPLNPASTTLPVLSAATSILSLPLITVSCVPSAPNKPDEATSSVFLTSALGVSSVATTTSTSSVSSGMRRVRLQARSRCSSRHRTHPGRST